jgi:hypothetical protein
MPVDTSRLYEPMIHRDLDGIREEIGRQQQTASSEELLAAVTRFATLAFTPSQHGKGSLLAAVAASDLAQAEPDLDLAALATECAVYASAVRPPWSEAPITDPPPVDDRDPAVDELLPIVEAGDRHAAEEWLARWLGRRDARLLFDAATIDLSNEGQKAIVAVAAWRYAGRIPPQFAFAALRVAALEWTSYSGASGPVNSSEVRFDGNQIFARLLDRYDASGGSPLSFLQIACFDAALEIAGLAPEASNRIMAFLGMAIEADDPSAEERSGTPIESRHQLAGEAAALRPPIYSYGRDFASYLQAYAFRSRWRNALDRDDLNRLCAVAWSNLESGPSFEDFSFA